MVFLTGFVDGSVGVLLRDGIFLHVMVGVDGGVTGPNELMGWFDTVTDGRDYPPPTPLSVELKQFFFKTCEML